MTILIANKIGDANAMASAQSILRSFHARTVIVDNIMSLRPALANAEHLSAGLQPVTPYQEARAWLIEQGWQPLVNQQIDRSGLYASNVYAHGMTEVVDCISMEIDGCSFRFIRKQHGERSKPFRGNYSWRVFKSIKYIIKPLFL